jgi:hypothetical protein
MTSANYPTKRGNTEMKRALFIVLAVAFMLPFVASGSSSSVAACNPTALPPHVEGVRRYAYAVGTVGSGGGCSDVTWYWTIKLKNGANVTLAKESGGPVSYGSDVLFTNYAYCIRSDGQGMTLASYLYINVQGQGKGSWSAPDTCRT